MIPPRNSPQTAVADPRSLYLAEALASLHDQAKTIRTPQALGADLLAEALLQSRYGRPAGGSAPIVVAPAQAGAPVAMTPPGGPVSLQPVPASQAAPFASPSPGAPSPSAPAGTASPAPAATSPAAGAAMGPAYAEPALIDRGRAALIHGIPSGPQASGPAGGLAPALIAVPPQVLGGARAAVLRGADPGRVRARQAAHGYDPRSL